MFNKAAPVTESAPDVVVPADLVPLSHLALDLQAPQLGWPAYLAGRGVEVTLDDIGRAAISRADARQLFDEQRQAEAEQARKRADLERAAVEQDRLRRAQIWGGLPAGRVPADLQPVEAMVLAGESSGPRAKSVREQLLERELGSGESLVFHSFGPDEEA